MPSASFDAQEHEKDFRRIETPLNRKAVGAKPSRIFLANNLSGYQAAKKHGATGKS